MHRPRPAHHGVRPRWAGERALALLAAAALGAQTVLLAAGAQLAPLDPGHAHLGWGPVPVHAHPAPHDAGDATLPHCDTGPVHQHANPDLGVYCAPGHRGSASATTAALPAPALALPATAACTARIAPVPRAAAAPRRAPEPPPPRA